MRRIPLLTTFCAITTVVCSIANCAGDPGPDELVLHAQELRAQGQPEAALTALRRAMRESPEDLEIRLLLAEIYLDLDEGQLAETAVDQAIDRGLSPTRAVLPRARALFLAKQHRELLELEVPVDVSTDDRLRLLHLKARARAVRHGFEDDSASSVVNAFIEVFQQIDAHENSMAAREIRSELNNARENQSYVDRAWQHFACSKDTPHYVDWVPIERPGRRVLKVGHDREIKTPADAAAVARDGDIVEIDPGLYPGGVALWPQNNLIVRGSGQRPIITASGRSIKRRDVWLFSGNNIVVENVEISGARSPWENGAAIRHIGSGLTLRHVFLHGNENGILTGNRHPETNEILIEFSEFARNGDDKGFAHNIYIGRSKSFELNYSYSHGSKSGHLVKSRARENEIAYNRLTDGEGSTSSYIIDIPEGGLAQIVGNVIEQGPETMNHGMISYAGESANHRDNQLVIANNSFYNRDFKGIAVRNRAELSVTLVNNLFGGAPVTTSDGGAKLLGNQLLPDHGMVDPRNYDFSLISGANAIDSGIDFIVRSTKEYVHPLRWRKRQAIWKTDVGAYERCGI